MATEDVDVTACRPGLLTAGTWLVIGEVPPTARHPPRTPFRTCTRCGQRSNPPPSEYPQSPQAGPALTAGEPG